MPRWIIRLALPAVAGLAVLTACTPSDPVTPTGVSETASAAASTPAATPIKTADCGATPEAGGYDFQGKRVVINHTAVDCGNTFTEFVDFTRLGDWPTCSSSPDAAEDMRRPCKEPLKSQPDARSQTLTGWQPTEGQDTLMVECQVIANTTLNQGVLRNNRSESSNVWNKVRDERLPGSTGWINDIWMGNAGFRGKACDPADAYDPAKP